MPADAQMLGIAEKELELQQNMADKLEAMNKDHKEAMMVLTENLNLEQYYEQCFLILATGINSKVKQQPTSILQPVCQSVSPATITHFARFASPSFSIHPYSW